MNKFGTILANVVTIEQTPKARVATGPRKEWNPINGADIRIWKDGSVYPSQALVDRLGLEFTARTVSDDGKGWKDEPGGFGFDVFDTANYTGMQGAAFIAVNIVARKEGKIDLFGSCNYYTQKDADNKDIPEGSKVGDPVTSIMDQGSNTFGKTMLKMLNKAYGVIPNEAGYIDLHIVGQGEGKDQPFLNPNGSPVYYIPKEVKKGDKRGEMSYERRENAQIFALIPAEDSAEGELVEEVKEAKQPEAAVAAAPAAPTTGNAEGTPTPVAASLLS